MADTDDADSMYSTRLSGSSWEEAPLVPRGADREREREVTSVPRARTTACRASRAQ